MPDLPMISRLAALTVLLACTSTTWADGPYAGLRVSHALVDIKHDKDVHYNAGVLDAHPGGSHTSTSDTQDDPINSLSAVLGYRTSLGGNTWLAAELAGSVYSGSVRGYLEGSYRGDATPVPSEHVFPGAWRAEKDHSFGINARLGHDLNSHRSVYLLAGLQWLQTTMRTSFDNLATEGVIIRGTSRKTRSTTPWVFGAGLELGSGPHRFDVRAQYSSWDIGYSTGDGNAEESAYVPSGFDAEEIGLTVGYLRVF